MKYLKLYESWELGEEKWLILYKDEKFFFNEYWSTENDTLMPISNLDIDDVQRGFSTRQEAIMGLESLKENLAADTMGIIDPYDENQLLGGENDFIVKSFFIGAYMKGSDEDPNF